jgi:hypothetical protein
MTNDENSNKTAQGVAASLEKSIAESLDRQRSLWQEVSRIATNETTQFTKRRLAKTTSAFQSLKVDSSAPYGAVVSQQQWLHELVKDYTDQSLRYTKMLRSLAMDAFSIELAKGREAVDEGEEVVRAEASDAVETIQNANEDAIELGSHVISDVANAADEGSDHE